jgi:dihydrofolate reductase
MITDYLNSVAKYVLSSSLTDPQWSNSTVLSGDPIAAVRELKSAPGRDIVVTGSITLSHALIAAGLVDEFRLFVYPVVQGRGRRLFPDATRCRSCGCWVLRPRSAAESSCCATAAAERAGFAPE